MQVLNKLYNSSMQAVRRRIAIFTDKYPLIGPLVWVLGLQYFVAQVITARAWPRPYSWSTDMISDLGNTACGYYGQRYVCSPQHGLMNASLILLGITMAVGALLIYQEFKESKATLLCFLLMAVAGIGAMMVGLVPENVHVNIHGAAAFMALAVGNFSIVLLSLVLHKANIYLRTFTFVLGAASLSALAMFFSGRYFGLGAGGMERLASYPQTIWLILFGIYMMSNHYRQSLSMPSGKQ